MALSRKTVFMFRFGWMKSQTPEGLIERNKETAYGNGQLKKRSKPSGLIGDSVNPDGQLLTPNP